MQPNAAQPQGQKLAPGVSYFMVLQAKPLTAANGDTIYDMVGPWATLEEATMYGSQHAGSLITATLVLHQCRPMAPPKLSPIPQKPS